LHAYVDGSLDDEGMARVEEYLRRNPDAARRVWDYLHQRDDIREFAARRIHDEPARATYRLGEKLARRLQPRKPGTHKRLLAVAFVFFAGWVGHSVYVPFAHGPSFASELVQAHMLSTADPAEIPPLSQERLTRMFSRIGEWEQLPDLTAF